ncbi:MAG: hypothetical protein HQM10_22960 [Candidatus Riflebacteria bacterium]|nr:hypothetical protein [Candidatus Riflebacteria bacterium]
MGLFRKVLLSILLLSAITLALPAVEQLQCTDRLSDQKLNEAILGALVYLEDTQIRPRQGKNSLLTDSSDEGDGCHSQIAINTPFKEVISLPALVPVKMRNRTGDWASHVHFLPKKAGLEGRTLLTIQDSNMFVTAFIAFPLFLFEEDQNSVGSGFIKNILQLCKKNIELCKRGDSYNFWPILPGVTSPSPRTGPYNIPVEFLKKLGESYVNPKFESFFKKLSKGLQVPPKDWLVACLDSKNTSGADALFNIPNDADDTSTVVAFQKALADKYPLYGISVDLNALRLIQSFRDIDRTREDGRDAWKGKNTGAYLTWMRDENEPTFSKPEVGIIPLGVNNVDLVVNSNVVFSLALNGQKSLPGYMEAINLIARGIEAHAWPKAGLYYPQNMIFPYTATRAFREGGANEPVMREAMKKLLIQILEEQEYLAAKEPSLRGAFPGEEDRAYHLSTALGAVSLMNIGREIAIECGCMDRYSRAIHSAVAFLLKEAKKVKFNYNSTIKIFGDKIQPHCWESGLFFAASYWDLGHWRSQAFTVSVVLEALSKYALNFEKSDNNSDKTRLILRHDAKSKYGISLSRLNK